MKLLENMLNWGRKFLGGKEYQKLLQKEIKHHYYLGRGQLGDNQQVTDVIPEQHRHREAYIKLQTQHLTLYGNYHTFDQVTARRWWI